MKTNLATCLLLWLVITALRLPAQSLADNHSSIAATKVKAETGDASAQFNLAEAYFSGTNGLDRDLVRAAKWYRQSASHGNVPAELKLGHLYYAGQGVKQNYPQAAKWFRQAADHGDLQAQYELACCYDAGVGVPQDDAEAVKWYRLAAEHGHAKAQNNLGTCYENGQGVTQNYATAAQWFRRGAEQGEAAAEFNLGRFYDHGKYLPQNNHDAYVWLSRAAAQGDPDAANERDNVAIRLTSAEIIAAQNDAAAFVPRPQLPAPPPLKPAARP